MNPVYMLGQQSPELRESLGLLHPNELKERAYHYYFDKLYALVTNLFKWEIPENTHFPTRFIEIILNTQGTIMFGEGYTRGKQNQSVGKVFAPYVTVSGRLDFFGQPVAVRMTPYNYNGRAYTTKYLVKNSVGVTKEEIEPNEKVPICVIGNNTQLKENIEWLPFLCAKLALLDTATITNVNLLKQPLTIVADEFTEFSATQLVEEYSEGYNIIKAFGAGGRDLLDTLQVHQTGAQNYIDTYEKVRKDLLKEAYERMGISTNVVDKKERVLQLEQVTQNAVSNLMYAEKWQSRQKLVQDIKIVFDIDVKCTPVLTLPEQNDNLSDDKESEI